VRTSLFVVLAAAFVSGCGASAQIGSPAKPAVPMKARALPLADVRVTGGPLKRAQDLDAQYLLSLEVDRMMAFLRKSAGLVPKGSITCDGVSLTVSAVLAAMGAREGAG